MILNGNNFIKERNHLILLCLLFFWRLLIIYIWDHYLKLFYCNPCYHFNIQIANKISKNDLNVSF